MCTKREMHDTTIDEAASSSAPSKSSLASVALTDLIKQLFLSVWGTGLPAVDIPLKFFDSTLVRQHNRFAVLELQRRLVVGSAFLWTRFPQINLMRLHKTSSIGISTTPL